MAGVMAAAVTGVAVADPQALNEWPYATSVGNSTHYTLAAVGDIACEPSDGPSPAALKCGSPTLGGLSAEYATAQQADAMHPDLVALLGDEQYQVGTLSDFEGSFEQAWGGLKMLERPSPGNHEYYTKASYNDPAQNGNGYFAYFNGHDQAGTPNAQGQAGDDTASNQGWYSYNIGHWHVISLNIECNSAAFSNDCSTTDSGLLAQETQWLANDLASNHSTCTLAYWHQPTFSASATGASAAAPGAGSAEGGAADAWWNLLYKAHATLVLNGHEHYYARFKPMDPAGNSDPRHGITQFIVGTGGESLDTLATNADGSYTNPNVVTAQDQAFGVMKLTLGPSSYSWDYQPALTGPGFTPATAMSYSDSGTASCRGDD
jgi:hypothetical protein